MTTEIEEMLVRELDAVVSGVEVPPMPSLGLEDSRPRTARLWQPLLVAAAVVLIVGVVALVLSRQDGGTPQPAPSPSVPTLTNGSPTPGEAGGRIPLTPPTVPYILDQQLYVDGAVVPGDWALVDARGGVWLAQEFDGSWWWGGPGVQPSRIEAELEQPPTLSPNGHYVAFLDVSSEPTPLTGFTTRPGGEGFGAAPVEIPRTEDGVLPYVRAVTDDGDVIVQGTRTSVLWRSQQADQAVVDLTETAPDQVVLQGTAAGLVVVDGADGASDATGSEPYLATISPDGRLTTAGALPTYDDLDVSPGGSWFVRSPAGTLAGEVTSVATLTAQPVDGGDEVLWAPPAAGGFATGSWGWEDDEYLIAVLLRDDGAGQGGGRLVRCSVSLGSCRFLASPRTGAPSGAGSGASSRAAGTFSADEALDAVVRAVVEDDRAGLADQAVVADGEWDQLVDLAGAKGAGAIAPCRANGGGTFDCEIPFEADPSTTYYAIVEPAENGYGWRISYVGVGGA